MSIFLDDDDVVKLTGKKLKAGQVDALRRMGILFYINAAGWPVVPKSSIEGKQTSDTPKTTWVSNALRHG